MRHASIFCVAVLSANLIAAESPNPAGETANPLPPGVRERKCSDCHTNANPTKEAPALMPCPRLSAKHGPEVVLLDQLSSQYVPVVFAHKLHAQMTEIGGGCVLCHHYNPGNVVQPCRDCHGSPFAPENLSQPGLKGAYHRQCLNCHREWSHDTDCAVCHAKRTADSAAVRMPDPTDIMGILHPNIEEPEIRTYQTKYENGAMVTFRHKEHVDLFGFSCVNCHREESCSRCHSPEGRVAAVKTLDQHHRPCASCHDEATQKDDLCFHCHSDRETPPFDHAGTGWPLSRYHQNRSCRSCHPPELDFSRLNRECTACHNNWTLGSFDHAVTGVVLDADHLDTDCVDCHRERQFDLKPMCGECHEDDITYPAKSPGSPSQSF